MTIPYCVQIGDTLENSSQIQELIYGTFCEINAVYNNWNPDSEISKLNSLAKQQKKAISDCLFSFLSYTSQIVEKTEGRFDPTVGLLSLAWKKHLKQGCVPLPEELVHLEEAVGWDKIHLEEGLFWKDHSLTSLDVGGVAKGYAVDLLVERLKQLGLENIYVEWGGEIRTCGLHPQKRPWRIGILGLTAIDLTNSSIATSGSYIQEWKVGEDSYTHIIDPMTKRPLQNPPIASVSVIAPSCMEADALATALMLFPSIEEAQQWATSKGVEIAGIGT